MVIPATILFFAKKPMNVVLLRDVLERLRGRGDLRCLLAGRLHGRPGAEVFARAGLEGVRTVPTWWAQLRRYAVYVCPDFSLLGRRSRVKVHTFHGVSLKNHAIHERVRDFDKLFVVGEYMRRTLVERGILDEDDPRIERIGMPKCDALVDGSLRREEIASGFGLDPGRPIVLYAPTWGEGSSLESWGETILAALARGPAQVLVKLHDNSLDPRKTSVDWPARISALEGPTFRMVRDADVRPALVAADLLVSDASSVANEYLLLDRPIVFADCPDLLARVSDRADLETWGRRTGTVVRTPRELLAAVGAGLEDPGARSPLRRAASEDLFYDPGGATERAVACICRLAGMDARPDDPRGVVRAVRTLPSAVQRSPREPASIPLFGSVKKQLLHSDAAASRAAALLRRSQPSGVAPSSRLASRALRRPRC